MVTSQPAESFRDLLLRSRARSGLTQREVADRVGVNRRSVQDWENGANYPGADRLEALIRVLLDANGLPAGHEAAEAQALWASVQRESPRMHASFDQAWFARLLAEHASPADVIVVADAPAIASSNDASVPVEPAPDRDVAAVRREDWGEAPDTTGFLGRADELQTLMGWVVEERCRLVAVVGMGGIGKTSLVAKLARELAPGFQRVYWRSLRDALPPADWLAGAIGFLSDQQVVPPPSESQHLVVLLQLLRERRCLLVLDNLETLFEPGQHEGRYRQNLAGYARVVETLGRASHKSCLTLTSRERPPELAALSGVRSFQLGGLGVQDAEALLAPKQLVGTSEQWAELVAHFGGNGLALKVVGETIRDLFGGDIGAFLAEARASAVFGAIRRLLAEHIERSSAAEQQVLHVLAIEREPMTVAGLLAALGERARTADILETIEALRRRSLIERAEIPGAAAFTLQSVVLEYVTERLVEAATGEIELGQAALLVDQPLIKAQAKDYVRQTQEQLIGVSILGRLRQRLGEEGTEQRLLALLDAWRGQAAREQGYGPGNVVNLLRVMRGQLRGLDLSRLAVRQAYLAETDTHDASLVDAQLVDSVLAEAFPSAHAVALSGDNKLLAAGTSTGEVLLWRLADRTVLWTVQGHTDTVFSVALSADGQVVASAAADGTIGLWQAASTRPLAMLRGHTGKVWSVSLSGDGQLVASCGADRTVRLWESSTGRPLQTLEGHAGSVRGVALSSDGALLASGSEDGTVRVWAPASGRLLAVVSHGSGVTVYGVALSSDGGLLASGGEDGTVRLWDVSTGKLLRTLQAGSVGVWGVALTGDGELVASGGADGTVRLWIASTGEARAAVQGHTGSVFGVAVSGDGQLAASAGGDGAIKVWETSTSRALATLYGHSGTLWGVALSADGRLAACGGGDGRVRLWETRTGQPVATLHGHSGTVWGVALSADGLLVASCAADATVRLWRADTGRFVATLEGHTDAVLGVALSADGNLVASGGSDGTVKVWDTRSAARLMSLDAHGTTIWGVAFSADGRLLAAGAADGAVRLWETATGRPLAALQGHTGMVRDVALSADGRWIASAGAADGTLRLWDTSTARPILTLQAHADGVWGVALSPDGQLIASGGADGAVRLWQSSGGQPLGSVQTPNGEVLSVGLSGDGRLVAAGGADGMLRLWEPFAARAEPRILQPERRYARTNISGLTGITDAQRATLLALGAVEQDPAAAVTGRH